MSQNSNIVQPKGATKSLGQSEPKADVARDRLAAIRESVQAIQALALEQRPGDEHQPQSVLVSKVESVAAGPVVDITQPAGDSTVTTPDKMSIVEEPEADPAQKLLEEIRARIATATSERGDVGVGEVTIKGPEVVSSL